MSRTVTYGFFHQEVIEMEDMTEAPITGGVLQWARERRSMSFGELSRKAKVSADQLRQWEDGTAYPPLGKAEMLADVLDIPFGFLFLSTAPPDKSPITDFRTVSGNLPKQPSPALLKAVNYITSKQEWYRDFAEENNAQPVPVVGAFDMRSGHAAVAESIAATLHITEELRRSVSSHSSYLTQLSEAAQDAGVLVMRNGGSRKSPLVVSEFRGFALPDPYAPAVFINSRDSATAQVFTLLHELAHIWINRAGISNPDPSNYNSENIEVFCNRAAAEALIPEADFLAAWDILLDPSAFASRLSRVFWVSPLVIIVRAFELNKISDTEFFRLVRIEKNKPLPQKKKAKGGNPTVKVLARNSRRFTSAVLQALRTNRLVHRDASWLLGVRRMGLNKLLAKLAT
jgi:Zn-dependent peptidase ImmA (M78 family)/transcriptional regulator with XRE-family HTH domain